MTHPTVGEKDFRLKQLKPLIGGQIMTGVVDDTDGYNLWLGLSIEKDEKSKILWFLADDEGNAPGSFDIQDQGSQIRDDENVSKSQAVTITLTGAGLAFLLKAREGSILSDEEIIAAALNLYDMKFGGGGGMK